MSKAPIGLAIIARDAEKTLPVLLKTVRPYVKQIVVGVDVLTKDRTAKVAGGKHGADEVFPLIVSTEHECADHGKVMAQHFGEARQQSFTHLDPDLPWWLWLDADDVLRGGDRLQAFVDGMPEDAIGAWWPYEYAALTRADGTRHVNTLFHRERLLRTKLNGQPVKWRWEGRVHETVKPDIEGQWIINDSIVVAHQPRAHDTTRSAPRNLLLLEIDYEEDPKSARTIFYLGNQYFAMGNWPMAINWYELLTSGIGDNPYELWQAYIYMSHAYERMEDLTNAARSAYGAMDVHPEHPEPYLRLASIANLAREHEKALFWDQLGSRMTEPPFFVFKNPLDYTYNRLVVKGQAELDLGRLLQARRTWEEASKIFVDDRLAQALQTVNKRTDDMAAAEGFVQVAKAIPEQAAGLYEKLPQEVKAFGRTRDLVMPSALSARQKSTRRVVFWCGKSLEPWAPPVLNTTGIGGSETAVIEIAKRFAADGWTVDVFNDAEYMEGVYDGVGYWDCKRFDWQSVDVFVSWRQPRMETSQRPGKQNVLWCHDLNYGVDEPGYFHVWNHVLGVSRWHADMLEGYYGIAADFVPNGIDLRRFHGEIRKIPFRCVYASSPDRGLSQILSFWPEILTAEPTAELHVAYGWENIDKMIAGGRRDLQAFRIDMTERIEKAKNVVWHGRLPQDELARLYMESVAWVYPCDFLEVSCISAMEAMAAGCIPVVTRAGALPETIGDAGLLIPGPPQSRGFGDLFPKAVLGVLCELNTQVIYRAKARERAKMFTWDAAYAKWKQVLGLEDRENGHEPQWKRTADDLMEIRA